MAIGISPGGFDPRSASALPPRRERDARPTPATERFGAALDAEVFDARAARAGDAAASGRLTRISPVELGGRAPSLRGGIGTYLDIERNTIATPAGGELVGIDLFV